MVSDEYANIAYLAVLALVLGVGLWQFERGNLPKLGSNIVIWILIFLVFILGASYKNRLKSIFVAGNPPEIVDARSMVIPKARSGHFETQIAINGKLIPAMIDTGATNIVLSQSDAKAAGIDIDGLRYNIQTSTANGMSQNAITSVDSFALGNRVDENVEILVSSGGLDQTLIGMSYLNRFDEVVITSDTLTLRW